MPLPAGNNTVLLKLEQNLETARGQLSENLPSLENRSFNQDTFWTNFISAAELISHEATKLATMFEKPPFPSKEETQQLADNVERICLSFVAVYMSLPKSVGHYLHKEIHQYVLSVLQKMEELCFTAREKRHSLLLKVGQVWDTCKSASSLPKDNKIAVYILLSNEFGIMEDSTRELMDEIERARNPENEEVIGPDSQTDDGDFTGTRWSDADKQVLLPCLGLAKAAKACLKKVVNAVSVNGSVDNEHCIKELDDIADIIKNSSWLLDDLAILLYPPMDHSIVREQVTDVRDQFKKLLNYLKECHVCLEADREWIRFLEKALDHNWLKITDLLLVD